MKSMFSLFLIFVSNLSLNGCSSVPGGSEVSGRLASLVHLLPLKKIAWIIHRPAGSLEELKQRRVAKDAFAILPKNQTRELPEY